MFEPFVVPKWPIFKALSALRGANIAQHGLKMGSFHSFVHPQIVQKYLWKNTFFDPFLTDFWSQNSPFLKAFCDFGGAKNGSQWAQNGLISLV